MQRERGTMRAGPKEHSVVAIYDSHAGAEAAIITLQHAGLDMKHLSIVGKDLQTEEHALSFYTSSDRMKYWEGRGVFWGSICGMLFGDALFLIPAIGPLVAMGPLAGWIAGALEGAVVGGAAGGLAAALASIGIPKDSVVKYELEVKAGRFLLLAHGPTGFIDQARNILGTTEAAQVTAHANWAGARNHAPMLLPARSESSREDERAGYATRESILGVLSGDELAHLWKPETAARLSDGEEYLDLEQLEQGVRQARRTITPMGRVLPRKAVHQSTWSTILEKLASRRDETRAGFVNQTFETDGGA